MPRYMIEREIPGAGQMSDVELRTISKQSISIIKELGAGLAWVESFVTADKIYCVYESPNAALIHEHARCMGIPASAVAEVRMTIDPRTLDA